jgi:hypothetical protein
MAQKTLTNIGITGYIVIILSYASISVIIVRLMEAISRGNLIVVQNGSQGILVM